MATTAGAEKLIAPADFQNEGANIEIGELDDDDSTYAASSIDSDTTSLSSSVFNYHYENGRRYTSQRTSGGDYALPNDETEQERLDLMHHLFNLFMKGELFLAPVKNPKRILDLGCGTGMLPFLLYFVSFIGDINIRQVFGQSILLTLTQKPKLLVLVCIFSEKYSCNCIYNHWNANCRQICHQSSQDGFHQMFSLRSMTLKMNGVSAKNSISSTAVALMDPLAVGLNCSNRYMSKYFVLFLILAICITIRFPSLHPKLSSHICTTAFPPYIHTVGSSNQKIRPAILHRAAMSNSKRPM